LFEAVNTLLDNRHFYAFDEIEYERKRLLQSKENMSFIDLGAGSRKGNSTSKKIAEVASSSLSSAWQCQILFSLGLWLEPKNVIEIGSSLGVSSAYIGKACGKAQVYSLEGNKDSLTIAKKLVKNVKSRNVEFISGNFDDTLPKLLDSLESVDLVFADGNHRKDATINYFNWIKEKCTSRSCIVFDDIYWSKGMTEAWEYIKADKDVKASLDFFYFGIVFFNTDFKEEKHLKVVEDKFKPWQKYI
jgi:predicted O-methyltransferase YrrM